MRLYQRILSVDFVPNDNVVMDLVYRETISMKIVSGGRLELSLIPTKDEVPLVSDS